MKVCRIRSENPAAQEIHVPESWDFMVSEFFWVSEHWTHRDDNSIYIPSRLIRERPTLTPLFDEGREWVVSFWSPDCLRAIIKALFPDYLKLVEENASSEIAQKHFEVVRSTFKLSRVWGTKARYWEISQALSTRLRASANNALVIRHNEAWLDLWIANAVRESEQGVTALA